MYIERSHAIYQDGPNSSVPAGSAPEADLESYYFMVGAELESGSISNFRIAGPPEPLGEPIPYDAEDQAYELEQSYSSESELSNEITAGTYTFSGTGNTVGYFSENVYIPTYSPLSNLLITNYSELQSFDPAQPLTIEWEPFTEWETAAGGVIFVEISYDTGMGDQFVWDSEGLPSTNPFGLDPDTTSVEVPAGTLTGSPDGKYFVGMGFIRIDSMEYLGSSSPIEGTLLASITGLEMLTQIQARPSYHQDRLYLSPGSWIQDPRLGDVYGYDDDWGYSKGFGLVHVAWTPHWFWQERLGWLSVIAGDYATGMWIFAKDHGMIYVHGSWPEGEYWSDQLQKHLNMIDPGV